MTAITWNTALSGDWSSATAWSSAPQVPTATDDVVISQPGTYTVTESVAESANSLVLDSPDATLVLDAPLTITGAFTLDAGTIVFDGGTITADTINLSGGMVTGHAVSLYYYSEFNNAITVSAPVLNISGLDNACFLTGTGIATPDGETPVEQIRAGDRVRTASGASRQVIWVGQRALTLADHPKPETVRPVRIAAHAFGDNQPAADLLVSPDHAIYVENVLIPAKLLINGTTIRSDHQIQLLVYWHVELDSHDILLANGLPVESYLDTGQRSAFANGGGAEHLHPRFVSDDTAWMWEIFGAAPLLLSGPIVAAVRESLAARAQDVISQAA